MVKKHPFQSVIGKFFYGSLFVILVPAFLLFWTSLLDRSIQWLVPDWPIFSISMICFALFLMLKGMLDLYIFGKGLPMNAYPPQKFVKQGAYAYFSHPIYVGSVCLSTGISLWFRSSSGLYIITPILILSIFSLLYGYELLAMQRLFGQDMHQHQSLFSLPHSSEAKASWLKKIAMLLRVFLPWLLIGYFVDYVRCASCGSFIQLLHMQQWHGVWSLLWLLPFLFLMTQIGAARTQTDLLQTVIRSTLATGLYMYLYLLLPMPGFHFLDPNWGFLLTGLITLFIAIKYRAIWSLLQSISERVANSRQDWVFINGRVRVINHSVYSGLAGAVGVGIASYILGNNLAALLLLVCVLFGAAIFAQSLWGSNVLLRPFGYWGAILGGIIGITLSYFFFGIPFSTLAIAGVLAAPFVQAIGRLRCLVQGCCHGVVTNKNLGIRVWQPQSRVVVLSGLKGEYILNTQLYSIFFNVFSGLLLWSMWLAQDLGISFITGFYILLTGIERFAEDAYRGEKQTRTGKGLKENQWIAIGAFITGVIITTLPSSSHPEIVGSFDLAFFATVLIGGLLTAFAMSIDFPKSQLRFSRLSG